MRNKRLIDICILSDLHLGTSACDANSLLSYLKSIKPKTIILNGDIIDIWNFRKSQFSQIQLMVMSEILKLMKEGTKIVYITGNHDEILRRYSGFELQNFSIRDKYIFKVNGQTHWVFHGDVFDRTTKGYAKIIARLGGKGYDLLIFLNRWINKVSQFFGYEKLSFSKKVKSSVKMAVSWIDNFEKTAAEIAIKQGYDYVICGHIHESKIETVVGEDGSVIYMNSGDWVESLSALEMYDGEWHLYKHTSQIKETKIEDEFDLKKFNQKLAIDLLQEVF